MTKRTFALIVIAAYLAAVILCLHQAFDFAPTDSNFKWFLAVIALTLPWSMVSTLFVILTHGTGLSWTYMYLSFACVNSAIFYWICSRLKKPENDDYLIGPRTSS